jgi:hypothetical protein
MCVPAWLPAWLPTCLPDCLPAYMTTCLPDLLPAWLPGCCLPDWLADRWKIINWISRPVFCWCSLDDNWSWERKNKSRQLVLTFYTNLHLHSLLLFSPLADLGKYSNKTVIFQVSFVVNIKSYSSSEILENMENRIEMLSLKNVFLCTYIVIFAVWL